MSAQGVADPDWSGETGSGLSKARMTRLYDVHRLSTTAAYLLLVSLGWLGAHRFYLKQPLPALCLIVLSLAAVALLPSAPLLGLLVVLWLLVDAFLVAGMVRAHNREVLAGLRDGTLR